eukprot:CAMPEP_0184498812 /NCGR_PEP_ID=MMETSP0113_2-20130426/39908_1 /TAXON_ID=91329 /ORGANISM="Norrisiella sphaerica, Strain BC52" /LENGTH=263 /DNA_ID=CAMNT_0026886473 /DNA_START=309 /DNA_END=1100 /DNA_ORIENTATION=-
MPNLAPNRELVPPRAGESTGGDGGKKPPRRKDKEGGGDDGDGDDDALARGLRRIIRVLLPVSLVACAAEVVINYIPSVMDSWTAGKLQLWDSLKNIGYALTHFGSGGSGGNFHTGGMWYPNEGSEGDGGMAMYGYDFRKWAEPSDSDEEQAEMDLGEMLFVNLREKALLYGPRPYKKLHQRSRKMRMGGKNKKTLRPIRAGKRSVHRRRGRKGPSKLRPKRRRYKRPAARDIGKAKAEEQRMKAEQYAKAMVGGGGGGGFGPF